MSLTPTVPAPASISPVEQIVADIAVTRVSERGQTRIDDQAGEAAMEDRKREGYF